MIQAVRADSLTTKDFAPRHRKKTEPGPEAGAAAYAKPKTFFILNHYTGIQDFIKTEKDIFVRTRNGLPIQERRATDY